MADQRSGFRFRLPWLPAASASRPAAPRPPAQPTPAPRRAPETQVPSQPTSTTTTPSPGQRSTASATPTPAAPQRTAETQVPTQPKSTTTPATSQSTNATTVTPQIQSPTKDMPPSSATTKKAETEAPSASIPDKATSVPEKEKTQADQTQPPTQSTAPIAADTQTSQTQPSSQPTATDTSKRSPIRSPGASATSPQAPLPQPQGSRTESQPSSPARLPQSRAASQPTSPSRATNQSRTSQPATPPHVASQSRATSVLSSPSRKGSPKSPTPRTTSQPTSQPRTPPRPVAGQTPTSSPSTKVPKGQPTTAAHAESTFPSKGETRPSSPSVLEKEPKSITSAQQPTEQLQPKEETKSSITSESQTQTPVKASTESNGIAPQPFKVSGKETTTTSTSPTGTPQTSTHSKKSDTPTRNGKPESFPQDSKPEEPKEVKEIMQETEKKANKEAIEKDDYHPTRDITSPVQTKVQLSFISQSEKRQQAVEQKEVMPRPVSNGKDTKTTAQPRNKTVSVESRQKLPMTNGEHIPLHKEIRGDISKLVKKMAAGDPTQATKEKPVCVITLAGENRGATMQLGADSMKKGSPVPIRRGYKVNPDEGVETSTDGEGSFKVRSDDTKETEDQAPEAFINSNIQGINNSIMFNGSITERNPGVHLVHSRFPIKYKKSMEETEFLGKEKTEFSVVHAQRPIYQPMVKRRCLRGLLLESSDSDPENTTKPRRHGCRVGCKEKS